MAKKHLSWLVIAVGSALVVYFAAAVGPLRLLAAAAQMGWGLAALLALPVLLYLVHAIGWAYTMSAGNRARVGLARLTALTAFSYGLAGVIPLQVFTDQGINLTNVNTIAVGLGSKGDVTAAGGSGMMYIDDIRLYRP